MCNTYVCYSTYHKFLIIYSCGFMPYLDFFSLNTRIDPLFCGADLGFYRLLGFNRRKPHHRDNCEYAKAPPMAKATPTSSETPTVSCSLVQAMSRITTVLKLPATLNYTCWPQLAASRLDQLTVNADVRPIIRNCDKLSSAATTPERTSA